ncbi:MAG TPA: sensor domain-containing diguanylate cyclase, partial [Kofleriaceae bacterium]|nr:sensor domain-containing diguanylate cyclase [Kofleriaceae bacterium]
WQQIGLVALIVSALAAVGLAAMHVRTSVAEEGLAVRRASLEQAHKRAVSLSRFAELVQNSRDAGEIRTATVTMLESSLPGGEVQVAEWAESRDRLVTTWPAPGEAHDPASGIPMEKCPVVRRQRLVRAEVGTPQACANCAFGVPSAGAYACVPMRAAGEVIGLANIRTSKTGWTHNELMLAQSYVSFAAAALEALRVLASIHDRAVKDGLTGAYNRRFLDEYLQRRLAEGVRHGQSLSLMMIDLDHFKKLNDTCGHATGDRALIETAAVVNSKIRASDVLVRYGGEEFCLVLGATDHAGAMVVAERIRAAVELVRLNVPGREEPATITTSIGVASAPEHGETASELLLVGDRALYRAKHGGRNRVEAGERLPDDISKEVSRSG